jgi:hypothetical protein
VDYDFSTKTNSNEWETAVTDGKAYELSAVANGAYAIPNGVTVAMKMTGIDINVIMKGYFINSDKNPFDITFYEDAVITGGTPAPLTPRNRNRLSTNTSGLTVTIVAGTTGVTGTQLTPIGAYAGSTAFNFANVDGLPEKWILAPNKDYAVVLYNKSGAAANLVARMFWIEE